MNKDISEAKGDIIMRIDAHTFYEPNYCYAIVKRLKGKFTVKAVL